VQGSERILCVDPGLKTGVARLDRSENDVTVNESFELDEHEVAPWLREHLAGWTDRMTSGEGHTIVVYERFIITPRTATLTQAPWSLELIGVTKQVCRDLEYPVERMYGQTPAEGKSVVDNKKLQRLELWHRGGAGHANDAIRHGVLNLINRGWRDPRFLA